MRKKSIRITAAAFNRSIEVALRNPPNPERSIDMIKHAINSLPAGTLYVSNRKKDTIFYQLVDGHQRYLSKRAGELHPLARKKYLELLLEILELTGAEGRRKRERRAALIRKLQKLIEVYERGNLDIARVVLTSRQHKWFTGDFMQKHINEAKAIKTACGIPVRSRPERDIINTCEAWAVPLHYEEVMYIDVRFMVRKLEEELREMGVLRGQVYSYRNGEIHWNVPAELAWMNARGSIWMSYYPPNGTIRIYNDIKIMFADGTVLIWEHEGMMGLFMYRQNATERAAVIKYTGIVDEEHFLETLERDVDTPEKLIDILEQHVLPRLWF